MKLFTIGFTKKSAEQFFKLLIENKINIVIDIRRNNESQLAGFTKKNDLKYFLEMVANINYIHLKEFAPDEILLKKYRSKEINWSQFEEKYLDQIKKVELWKDFDVGILQNGCLLCSESSPAKCHRRLLAEFLQRKFNNIPIEIIHL